LCLVQGGLSNSKYIEIFAGFCENFQIFIDAGQSADGSAMVKLLYLIKACGESSLYSALIQGHGRQDHRTARILQPHRL
jgi:hypothetical protein